LLGSSASTWSIWVASRSQRCARSRCASLRTGSAMELAALRHSSARTRNLSPVIMGSGLAKTRPTGHHMHRSTDRTLGEKIDQLGRWAPFNLVDEPALQTLNPTRPRQAADSEALKSETVGSRVGVAGEQPYRAGQGSAALHAGVGDIFKIVRPGTVIQLRGSDGRDGRDHHPVSAMWAGEKEARQARCRNTQVSHGTPPIRIYPTTCGLFPAPFIKVSTNICAMHNLCASQQHCFQCIGPMRF
jgi:hypothetical protein